MTISETRHLTYEYNDVHALTQVDYDDAGAVIAYTYDYAGNRLTRKEDGDVVEQYEYDAAMLDLVDTMKSAIDNAQASIGADGMPAAIRNMESVARQCVETFDRREDIITGAAGQ